MWDVKSEDGKEGVVGHSGREGGRRRGKKVCALRLLLLSHFLFLYPRVSYLKNYNIKGRKVRERERVLEPASSSSSSSSFSSLRLQMPKSNHPQSPKKTRFVLYTYFFLLELYTTYQTVLRRSRRESEVYAVHSAYMIINLLLFLTSDTNNN